MGARVTGVPSLNRKLKQLREVTATQMEPAMGQAAQVIVSEQKRLVPVKTGALRNSIGWRFGDPPADAKLGGGPRSRNSTRVSIYAGDFTAWYARIIEFGTVKARAQPFFYPGYRATRKRAKAIITKAVKAAVIKATH